MWIHPSYQADARRAVRSVSVLTVLLILFGSLTLPASLDRFAGYLPLHALAEALSVVVASLIFAVLWTSRREPLPGNLILLGSTCLGAGLLDLLHLLSYPGMPDFITPNDAGKSMYFWLLARLFGGLGLLAVALLVRKDRSLRILPLWAQVAGVLATVAGLTVLYFQWPHGVSLAVPVGLGAIASRIFAEYGLVALYLIVALLFWLRMRMPHRHDLGDLFVAACVMAQGEFLLTLRTGAEDAHMLAAHLYKVVAYAFLYRLVFVEAVRRPYVLLRDSEAKLRATLDAMPDLVFDMDADGRYLSVHTSRPSDLAVPEEKLLGSTVNDVLSPKCARIVLDALQEATARGQSRGKIITLEMRGASRDFELSVARKAMPPGHAPQFVVVSRDITVRLKNEQALRTLSTAVVQSPVSIIITDRHARVEFVNDAFTRISGYEASEVLGRNLRRLKPARTPTTTFRTMWAQLAEGRAWRGEWNNLSKSGREYVESVLIYPIRNAQGQITNYLAHNEDLTEKRRAVERIRRLSQFDQLTGLPNRSQLREQCRELMGRADPVAALWLDLDHFKVINDSLGHHVGDALLQEMAQRLRARLPGTAFLSRYSGDDFVAVLPATERQQALAHARTLLQAVTLPLRLADQDIFSSATIGVALYPDDAVGFDALLKSAETAMYRAKGDGRHQIGMFTPEMQARVSRELMLGNALKKALSNRELSLVYQPQLALDDGSILGAEALLRWQSPQWSDVLPTEFVPIAEANGLIIPIGEWVLRTAMQQLRRWLDQGLPPLRIAVNLSTVQFNQPDLPGRVKQILADTRVPADLLELELTEAVAMKAPDAAARRMAELSSAGVRFAIDDFGTGYSSLSYLKRFKLHKLKIDQSFVRDITVDAEDQAIAVAVIQLSRSLGLRTIAEGVETVEQQEFLRASGCEEVQGYYYSEPLEADAFAAFVLGRQARLSS